MPQLHKLTRGQKILLSKKGLNPNDYLLSRDMPNTLILVNKTTKEYLVVEK